ncbi:hypothetical protein NL676_028966 [Syzygium grande]|nr:hypothetical protein NL676_028966 [Syzygium grande]
MSEPIWCGWRSKFRREDIESTTLGRVHSLHIFNTQPSTLWFLVLGDAANFQEIAVIVIPVASPSRPCRATDSWTSRELCREPAHTVEPSLLVSPPCATAKPSHDDFLFRRLSNVHPY